MNLQDFTCSACDGVTFEDHVKMSFWEDERLVIVENVPARICRECGEQYYEQSVRLQIEKLRNDGFPADGADRIIETPVFVLPPIEEPEAAEGDDEQSEWHDPAKQAGMY